MPTQPSQRDQRAPLLPGIDLALWTRLIGVVLLVAAVAIVLLAL